MLLTRDHLPETISDIASLDELLCRNPGQGTCIGRYRDVAPSMIPWTRPNQHKL